VLAIVLGKITTKGYEEEGRVKREE